MKSVFILMVQKLVSSLIKNIAFIPLLLIVTGCTSEKAQPEIKSNPKTAIEVYRSDRNARNHSAFAVSTGTGYAHCTGENSIEEAKECALNRCNDSNWSGPGAKCTIISIDGNDVVQDIYQYLPEYIYFPIKLELFDYKSNNKQFINAIIISNLYTRNMKIVSENGFTICEGTPESNNSQNYRFQAICLRDFEFNGIAKPIGYYTKGSIAGAIMFEATLFRGKSYIKITAVDATEIE